MRQGKSLTLVFEKIAVETDGFQKPQNPKSIGAGGGCFVEKEEKVLYALAADWNV